MATLPRLDRPTVRPTAEPSRLPAANPAQVAGAVAQGVAQVGQSFARELNRLNEIRVNEALESYARASDERVAELTAKRGTQAAEGLDPFRDKLTVARGDIEASLGNEDQRMLFARAAERYTQTANQRAMGHVQAETRRVDVESTDAIRRRLINQAATEGRNGVDTANTLRELDRTVALFGDRQGWTPEMIADARAEAVSNARVAQYTAMANTENEALISRARESFNEHKGTMTERDRQTVERALQAGDLLSKSAANEQRIYTMHPDDEKAALAEARKIEDVRVRDATVSRLLARYSQDHAAENRADTRVLETALEKVGRTGDIGTLTASEISTLERRGWMENVQARAIQVRNGHPPVTHRKAMEEIYAARANGTLWNIIPQTYVSRLNAADYRMLVDAVEAAKTGNDGQSNPALTSQDRDLYIFDVAKQLRLLPDNDARTPGELEGNEATAYEELRDRARLAVEESEREKGRNLTSPEIRNAIRLGFATLRAEQATAEAVAAARSAVTIRPGPGLTARGQVGVLRSGNVPMPNVPLTADERAREDWDGYVTRLQRNFGFTEAQAVEAADRAFGIRP